MLQQKFVKSFSHGQITIPKDFRDQLQLTPEFWLKLAIESGKIIAEPVATTSPDPDYAQTLLYISGAWFDEKEWQQNRKRVKTRLSRRRS